MTSSVDLFLYERGEEATWPGLDLDLRAWDPHLGTIPVMGNTYDALTDSYEEIKSSQWEQFLKELHLAICSETIERLVLETTSRLNGTQLYHFIYPDLSAHITAIKRLKEQLQKERARSQREETLYQLPGVWSFNPADLSHLACECLL